MLGAMMYPGVEDELGDMRVPPIQLEHLPEVLLCTYESTTSYRGVCASWDL